MHEKNQKKRQTGKNLMANNAMSPLSLSHKIKDIIEFADTHSPYYHRVFKELSEKELDSIPLLEKTDIYKNTPPEGADLLTGPLESAYIFASGGSTGAPKFCFYSFAEFDYVSFILSEIYKTAGVTNKDTVANLFMAGNLWTSFIAAAKAIEKIGCVSLPIAGNADIELIMRFLHLFRPTVIIGIPSIIIQVAEHAELEGQGSLKIDKILYGGEHLNPDAQQYIKRIFNSKMILSAGYASVDAGPIGFQCPFCTGSVHHLLSDYQVLQILDTENGEEIISDEIGEIIVTNLHRRFMPVIRYRTGDAGRKIQYKCKCGSEAPLFELMRRCDDVIRVGSVSIYPDEIERHLNSAKGAGRIFQMAAETKGKYDHLTIKIEAKTDEPGDFRQISEFLRNSILECNVDLKEALAEGWLGSFEIEIVPKNSIPRIRRTGKIKKVIDHRKI